MSIGEEIEQMAAADLRGWLKKFSQAARAAARGQKVDAAEVRQILDALGRTPRNFEDAVAVIGRVEEIREGCSRTPSIEELKKASAAYERAWAAVLEAQKAAEAARQRMDAISNARMSLRWAATEMNGFVARWPELFEGA